MCQHTCINCLAPVKGQQALSLEGGVLSVSVAFKAVDLFLVVSVG